MNSIGRPSMYRCLPGTPVGQIPVALPQGPVLPALVVPPGTSSDKQGEGQFRDGCVWPAFTGHPGNARLGGGHPLLHKSQALHIRPRLVALRVDWKSWDSSWSRCPPRWGLEKRHHTATSSQQLGTAGRGEKQPRDWKPGPPCPPEAIRNANKPHNNYTRVSTSLPASPTTCYEIKEDLFFN